MGGQTDGRTDRHIDRPTGRQAGRQYVCILFGRIHNKVTNRDLKNI